MTARQEAAPRRVYIAGPMSGYPDFNYPAFHAAARRLDAAGYIPVSPAADADERPVDPPEPDDAAPHWYYLRLAIAKLVNCDAIYLLDGWESSNGARLEKRIADACGLSVIRGV